MGNQIKILHDGQDNYTVIMYENILVDSKQHIELLQAKDAYNSKFGEIPKNYFGKNGLEKTIACKYTYRVDP